MKVSFTAGSPPTFEFEANSPKEIFERLALIQSLFNEKACGCCQSTDIVYEKREIDNGSYLELRCLACRAQLSFGQNKDGKGIFVKRWDKENNKPMPNNGLYVYSKNSSGPSSAPSRAQGPSPDADIPF